MNRVEPHTYLIGYTTVDYKELYAYLRETNQTEFMASVEEALSQGLQWGEILCSFYAKLCYKSLVPGKNQNVTKVRDIPDNLASCHAHGHGSVFEHCWLNFITTNCSRVFTHELVRHRAGTAFSQTSGRYVRSDQLDMVIEDPILDTQAGPTSVRNHLTTLAEHVEEVYNHINSQVDWDSMSFDQKKKLTSAMRRILPNGQANEIGWSCNLRAVRHLVQLRTSPAAEWEIRSVFGQVYEMVNDRFPTLFADATVETVDGLPCVTGMKIQPYDKA